ncbi:unnamed protein product [Ectocarpus fasciculatus]
MSSNAFRIRFICDRPGTTGTEVVARNRHDGGGAEATTWAEIARTLRCFGATAIQYGVDLKDCTAVPSPNHDIFVLTRSNSTAAEGRCPTKLVAFREPGGTAFQLELPLNSSLASVKAKLISATRTPRRKAHETRESPHYHYYQLRRKQQLLPKQTAASADVHDDQDGNTRDCTLIVGGNKMSSSYLLGDYLLKDSVTRACRRKPATTAVVLVLWHPRRQEQGGCRRTRAAAARKHCRVRSNPPSAAAATAATPRTTGTSPLQRRLDALRQACAAGRRGGERQDRGTMREGPGRPGEARRSVQRRCKSVARFSGMRRGARCGMGIRPLS